MSDTNGKDKAPAKTAAAAAAEPEAADKTTTGELKVVNRPNDAAIKKEQERLSRIITENNAKLQEVKAQLDALGTGSRGGPGGASSAPAGPPSPAQAIRDKLKALQKKIREEIDRSKALRDERNRLDAQKMAIIDKVKKLRGELDFNKEEDIDREITKLEDRLSHSTLSITEEKKVVSKIGTLRASKHAVGEQAAIAAQIPALDEKKKEVGAQARVVSDGITKLKEEETALRADLNKINEENKSKRADVPALLKRRDELRKVLRTHIELQRKLREDTDKQYAEWKAYRKESDRIQREEREKARAARAEAAAAAGGDAGEDGAVEIDSDGEEVVKLGAWAKEITACGDLVVYLEAIKAKRAAAASAAAAREAAAAAPKANVDGAQLMKGKRSANATFMDIGGNGKSAGKGSGGKKGGKKADAAAENLSHGLDTMIYFSAIELQPPATFAEIDDCIAAIRERKAHYESNPPKPEKKEGAKDGAKDDDKKKKGGKSAAGKQQAQNAKGPKVISDGPGPSPATSAPAPSGAWANRAKA